MADTNTVVTDHQVQSDERPLNDLVERENALEEDRPTYDAPAEEVSAEEPKPLSMRQQISDHEKWMSDHTDDARGVQERLQEIAVLQNKLAEMDQLKSETRVRQAQTI